MLNKVRTYESTVKLSKPAPVELYLVSKSRISIESERPVPTLQPKLGVAYRFFKRSFDILLSVLLLVITLPILILVSVAIKLTSKGPVVLKQKRLTQGGRVFTLYKFRSMKQDAEKSSGATLALKRDPRVTALGKVLRKTRIDELPQLVNVIKGEMSIIGPRPERPDIAEKLKQSIPYFDRRLRAKAGLTGLAQVLQGYPDDERGYRRKLALDMVYIQHQSILLDVWISLKTVLVMVTGHGAR
jgi:lipopolysaccharide/colanic/teichoic acid biosynthesis glycosyltransferase